jgi:hypothetical protein
MSAGSSHVRLCKPFPEHVEHHAQIVKELKERDYHDKIQGRESVKRSFSPYHLPHSLSGQ